MKNIVIVSTESDVHAQAVSNRLYKVHGIRAILLDLSVFPTKGTITAEVLSTGKKFCLNNSEAVELSSESSVWLRRPSAFVVDNQIWDESLRRFALRECWSTFEGMLYSSGCYLINDKLAEERANHKLYQLTVAHDVGFQIPETVITNSSQEALIFNESINGEVVFKAQSNVKYHLAETRLFDQNAKKNLDSIRFAPVIFQSHIPADFDIRVTVVGRELFAAKIDSQSGRPKIDWRVDIATPMELTAVPEVIVKPTMQLMNKLGLVYGALDMRVTPKGDVVFFEVNPAGQYLFCELNREFPITDALCRALVERWPI